MKTTYYAIEVDKDNRPRWSGEHMPKGTSVPVYQSNTIKDLAWSLSMSEEAVKKGIETQKPVGSFWLYRIDTDLDRLAESLGLVKKEPVNEGDSTNELQRHSSPN